MNVEIESILQFLKLIVKKNPHCLDIEGDKKFYDCYIQLIDYIS